MPGGKSDVKVNKHGDIAVFALSSLSPLHMTVVDSIEKTLLDEIANGTRKFVFDFSELDYVSSPLLKTLIVARKRVQPDDGRIALVGMNEEVQAVFKVVRLDMLFDTAFEVFDDLDAALEQLG